MKKASIFTFLTIFLLQASSAYAQQEITKRIGVKTGASISQVKIKEYEMTLDRKTDYTIGVVYVSQYLFSRFSFAAEALFTKKRWIGSMEAWSISGNTRIFSGRVDITYSYYYLSLPLSMRYTLSGKDTQLFWRVRRFYTETGLEPLFLIRDTEKIKLTGWEEWKGDINFFKQLKTFHYGWFFGGGFRFDTPWADMELGVRFFYALSSVDKHLKKSRLNSIQITLAAFLW